MIEDMPVVTLGFLLFHQSIAFPIYLTNNKFRAGEDGKSAAVEEESFLPWGGWTEFQANGYERYLKI